MPNDRSRLYSYIAVIKQQTLCARTFASTPLNCAVCVFPRTNPPWLPLIMEKPVSEMLRPW